MKRIPKWKRMYRAYCALERFARQNIDEDAKFWPVIHKMQVMEKKGWNRVEVLGSHYLIRSH